MSDSPEQSFLFARAVFASATSSHTCDTFSLFSSITLRLCNPSTFFMAFFPLVAWTNYVFINSCHSLALHGFALLSLLHSHCQSKTTEQLHKLSGMQKQWLEHGWAGERHWGKVWFRAPSHSLNQASVCYQTEKHERVSLLSLWGRCFSTGWAHTSSVP